MDLQNMVLEGTAWYGSGSGQVAGCCVVLCGNEPSGSKKNVEDFFTGSSWTLLYVVS